MPIPKVSERIRKEIIEGGIDDRYKLGAYEFVLNGLNFYTAKVGAPRHVSGQELSQGLLMFAHKQYGLMAQSVFDHWGIKSSDDLGYLVYNMIRVGLMSKQPYDSLDDFFDVADVREFFKDENADCFVIDKSFITRT